MGMIKLALVIAIFSLVSCTEKTEVPDEKNPEIVETYDNTFAVRCILPAHTRAQVTVDDEDVFTYTWEKDDRLYLVEAATGKKAGYAELVNGAGIASALFQISTNLEKGAEVKVYFGNEKGEVAARQTCSADDALPSAAVFESAVFTLSERPEEIQMTSPYSFMKFNAEAVSLDSLHISASGSESLCHGSDHIALIPDKSSPTTLWAVMRPVDLTDKTLAVKFWPGAHNTVLNGRNIEAGKIYSIGLAQSPMTPADKKAKEYTYGNVEYKKSGTATSFSKITNNISVDGMNWLPKLNVDTHDRYGGYDGVKPDQICSTNPEGYWRTGKYNGRWVMVNPDGNVTILHGCNGVAPDPMKAATSGKTQNLYKEHFSSTEEWSRYANRLLTDYGFNFYSLNVERIRNTRLFVSESDSKVMHGYTPDKQLGEVAFCYFLRTFWWDYYGITGKSFNMNDASQFTLMFDPEYLDYIDKMAADAAALYKNDRDFIGYYLDNELRFRISGNTSPAINLVEWLNIPTDSNKPRAFQYAKEYAENFMRSRGVEPVAANVTTALDDAFLLDISEYYYRTASEAMRRHDPNHLILGSRLHGRPLTLPQVHEACARYCDIVSVNMYNMWEPQDSYFISNYKSWIKNDKPCFVTEFYTRDLNKTFEMELYSGTGEGGGWYLKGDVNRGLHYQNFVRKLISYNHCIGWQWFQLTDDYSESNGWNNKGLISPKYVPYYEILEMMRQLHWNIYQIMDYYHSPSGAKDVTAYTETAYWEN